VHTAKLAGKAARARTSCCMDDCPVNIQGVREINIYDG